MKNNQPKSNKGLIAVMVLIIVVILILSGVVGYMLFGEQLGLTKLFSHETTAPATGEITTAAVTRGNNHRRRDYRRAYHSGADMGGSRYRRHEG